MAKFIDIKFKEDETKLIELQELFNDIGYRALFMTHYELADLAGESPIDWKMFLTDPRVSAFISEEMELLEKTKAAVMLNTVDTNKNTGQAQLLNTLLNRSNKETCKEGPVFIYTQVPLNDQEAKAKNVIIEGEEHEDNTN